MTTQRQKGLILIKPMIVLILTSVIGAGAYTVERRSFGAHNDIRFLSVHKLNEVSSVLMHNNLLSMTSNTDSLKAQPYRDIFPSDSMLVSSQNGHDNESDTITLRYPLSWAQNRFNCQRKIEIDNALAISQFYISRQGNLVCVDLNPSTSTKSEPIVLVEHVEAMHIRFGLDTNGDSRVDQYVTPQSKNLDPQHIKLFMVSMLIKTPDKNHSALNKRFYTLQDVEVGPYHDSHIRNIYTTSIKIQPGSLPNKEDKR